MTVKLGEMVHSMFRNRYERTINGKELKPYFYRFIGVSDISSYDDILKTLQKKCMRNPSVTLIFDNEIPFKPEMELIQYIYSELTNMDIYHMENQDINIFNDEDINKKFLKALDYIIKIAKEKENFLNDNLLKIGRAHV